MFFKRWIEKVAKKNVEILQNFAVWAVQRNAYLVRAVGCGVPRIRFGLVKLSAVFKLSQKSALASYISRTSALAEYYYRLSMIFREQSVVTVSRYSSWRAGFWFKNHANGILIRGWGLMVALAGKSCSLASSEMNVFVRVLLMKCMEIVEGISSGWDSAGGDREEIMRR